MRVPAGLRVCLTTSKGLGVFARKAFAMGQYVVPMSGAIVPREGIQDGEEDYALQVGAAEYIVKSGCIDDLVNHSCEPNCAVVMLNGGRYWLRAFRDIELGEEVTYDYALTTTEDRWQMPCSCRAAKCRGTVRSFAQMSETDKEFYRRLGLVPDHCEGLT